MDARRASVASALLGPPGHVHPGCATGGAAPRSHHPQIRARPTGHGWRPRAAVASGSGPVEPLRTPARGRATREPRHRLRAAARRTRAQAVLTGRRGCPSRPGPAGPAAWKADPSRAVPSAARSQTLAGPGRAGPDRRQPREPLGSDGPGGAAGGVCTAGGTERVSAARRAGITPWWPSRGADEREAAWQGGEEPGRGKGSAAARSGAQRGGRAAAMGR